MKTRIILFLAISAAITLSFTFSVTSNYQKENTKIEQTNSKVSSHPAGGFLAEDEL